MKRSNLPIVIMLAVISIVMAGCGATPEPAKAPEPTAISQQAEATAVTEAPTPTEAPVPTGAPAAPVEIEFWYVAINQFQEAHTKQVEAFEQSHPDIKVKLVPIPYEEITQKVAAQVPVGEGPDLVAPFYGWVPLWLQGGFLAPLPEDAFPPSELHDQFVPAMDAIRIDGRYYGIPTSVDVYALYYNKDYFAEAGISEPPKTWEELRETAIKLTKFDENGKMTRSGYFIWFEQSEHIIWKLALEQWGQPQFDAESRHVLWNASETGYEAFEWFMNLIRKDKISDLGFADSASLAFQQGLSAMGISTTSWITRIQDANPDLNYGIAPWICGPAEDEV